MSILAQLWVAVKNGLTLEQAIAKIVPGADINFWQPRVANYDPAAPRKRKRRRTTHRSRKTLRAEMPKGPSAFVQADARSLAMAEQVERVNGDEPEARAVLVNAHGTFYGVLEV